METNFKYNDSAWPLLEVHFPKHQPSREDVKQYLLKLKSYFERKEVFLLLIDLSDSGWVTPELRSEIGRWIMSDPVHVRKYMAGNAYVVKTQLLRLALQTFLSFEDINKVVDPIKVFNSLAEARKWSAEILAVKKN